ncbi:MULTISPECIES: hypothetical protein [Bacillales]|uniref:hypothetical protein n=1 Tax=Bacillales TaxID=1385 RepID=UPI000348E713|nr:MULTISPECIES: hypothetical protein [Bacillales]KMZ44114.1 hypothetical protein AC624_25185 [Bacillus sp. FJAT-27238]
MKKILSSLVAFSMLMLSVIPASANFEQPQSSSIEQHYEESKEKLVNYEILSEESQPTLSSSRLIAIAVRILVFSKRIDYILDDDTGEKLVYNQEDRDKAKEAIKEYYLKEGNLDYADIRKDGTVSSGEPIRFFSIPDGNGKAIVLEYGNMGSGMVHIATRHFLEYWTGNPTPHKGAKNSFFRPGTEFGYVEEVIEDAIKEHATKILRNYDELETRNYDTKYRGKEYRVVLSEGRVITVFPLSYNQGRER